jgi:phenylalanyl-tRNA synthetase beta chain
MRLVVSWLREFVHVTASAEEIAATLGVRGFEVASVERLGASDAVIDFEITANRPDCLSVVGLAREVATAFNLPLRLPSHDADAAIRLAALPTGRSDRVQIALDDPDMCPRYAGAVAEVTLGASPPWMAERLEAADVRPISNIVDVTNYVNIELGQPMHAFDLAKLAGAEIHARRAKRGETIRTLDGVERTLDPEMLVIADRDRAQAIAGVMGGADSEVTAATTAIVLESAYFNPVLVRRTSKRLGLKTEASTRFERGADVSAQVVAIERAAALMDRIGAGRIVGAVVDCNEGRYEPRQLHLRRARLSRLFGAMVPDGDVERILRALGMSVNATSDGWDVVVPLFRVDVMREVDLIEEVGRHYGFDRLEATFPSVTMAAPPAGAATTREQFIRRVATGAGMSEAITFGFIEERAAEIFTPDDRRDRLVRIANPLSAKFDTLRPSLVPGLIDAVAHNRRHGRRDVRLFEIGTRFSADGESRALAFAWTGVAAAEHWSGSTRTVDFFDAKGFVETLCASVGVTPQFDSVAAEPFLAAGQRAAVTAGAIPLGAVGQLDPAFADQRGLPRQDLLFVGELSLDALARSAGAELEAASSLPRYPSVVRDVSIVVANALPAEIIRGTIQTAARDLAAPLVATTIFDRYQGKGVPEGSVSLSLRLTFQAADRTLTDAEVQRSFDTILAALVTTHGAVQR